MREISLIGLLELGLFIMTSTKMTLVSAARLDGCHQQKCTTQEGNEASIPRK